MRNVVDEIIGKQGNWLQQLEAVEKGLPFKALARLSDLLGLTLAETGAIVGMSSRTVARRKEEGRLATDESDHLVRVAEVFDQAKRLFRNNGEAARDWLTHSQFGLGGARPIDVMHTQIGTRAVETVLGQIAHGIGP